MLAVVAAFCAVSLQARTVEDALKTRPEEDNRSAIESMARQIAGAWVANGEIRGDIIYEELVKDEESVKARWNMTKGQISVVDEERGGKCIRLCPDGKNFINLTQNAKKVVYCGTFTAGGLKVAVQDGKLVILQEGKKDKLVKAVEQVTFSGEYAQSVGQPVLYVTERAVFKLTPEGVELTEVAPGIDIEKDILAHMGFKPIMKDVKLMDERLFREEKMGLTL